MGSESEAMGHHYLVPEEMEPHVDPQPHFVERDEAGRCSWCRQPTRMLALITRQMHEHEPRLRADHVVACPPCAHACHDGGRRWERHLDALRRRTRIRIVRAADGPHEATLGYVGRLDIAEPNHVTIPVKPLVLL